MPTGRAIVYARVSTPKQGRSGLGLDAQRVAVDQWCASTGTQVLGEFVEVESGRKGNRPQLARALAACRRHRAPLVVAKLDRLARNVAFLSALQDSGVQFVACDQPHANRLTIDILSAVAEDEARRTSERTRAALARKKAKGAKLGHIETLTEKGRALGRAAVQAHREERFAGWAARHKRDVARLRKRAESLRELATALQDADVPTPTGRYEWHATTVQRVLQRLDAEV